MGPHKRAWVFVVNNYTEEEKTYVKEWTDVRYIVAGLEVGKKCGTPHIQGYVSFNSGRSLTQVRKHLKRAKWIVAKGTAEENQVYCKKDGNILIEHGELPKPGKRKDLDEVREMMRAGASVADIVDTDGVNLQGIKIARLHHQYHGKKRDPAVEPTVYWLWGPTGAGKSRYAWDIAGCKDGTYWHSGTIRWWPGYQGEETVVIDEFRGDFAKLHEFFKLIDRYPFYVECKNAGEWCRATTWWITSDRSPCECYPGATAGEHAQLLRRIKEVRKFGEAIPESNFGVLEAAARAPVIEE